MLGAVDLLLILDDLWIEGLELGLDDTVAGGRGRAVGAATWLAHVVVVVLELGLAFAAPVSSRRQGSSLEYGTGEGLLVGWQEDFG